MGCTRRCCLIILGACIVGVAVATVSRSVFADDVEDPLSVLLDEYVKSAQDIASQKGAMSSGQRQIWRSDWLSRLTEAAGKYPDSRSVDAVLVQAVGLCNSSGKYGESRRILGQLVSSADGVAAKIRWQSEKGEVARIQYVITRDVNDRDSAIADLLESDRLTVEAPAHIRARVAGQLVLNSIWRGEVYSKSGDRWLDAAQSYRSAREMLTPELVESDHRLALYDEEFLLAGELSNFARARNVDSAMESLVLISHLGTLRVPASLYAIQFLESAFSAKSAEYDAAASDLLVKLKSDSHTPVLRLALAESSFAKGQFQRAVDLYEQIRKEDIDAIVDMDKVILAAGGGGGHFPELLVNLGVSYWRLDKLSEAADVLDEFVSMFPQDSRVDRVRAYLNQIRNRSESSVAAATAEVDRHQYVFVLGANVVVLCVVIVALRRRSPA